MDKDTPTAAPAAESDPMAKTEAAVKIVGSAMDPIVADLDAAQLALFQGPNRSGLRFNMPTSATNSPNVPAPISARAELSAEPGTTGRGRGARTFRNEV